MRNALVKLLTSRSSSPSSLCGYDKDLVVRGTPRDKEDKETNHCEGGGDESVDTEIIALCSCEVRSRSGATSPPLSTFFPFALCSAASSFVLSLSFESPANSVRVCCMLPWLFLEPDALCYLPVRPTNSGCCLCVLLDVWAGLFMFIWARQKVRKHFFFFFFFSNRWISFMPPAASWRLWSSTWPPWRARRPRNWMQTPGGHLHFLPLIRFFFLEMSDHTQLKV